MQRSSSVSTFSWDKLTQTEKCSSQATALGGSSVSGGDPFLLARRCANCDTTSTPLWRNGPRGPKSLCNACGIRYKKEERRAAASSANSSMAVQGVSESISYLYPRGQPQHPWGCYAPASSTDATAKRSVLTMYAGEADQDQKEGFLPWRLSVVPPQFPAGDRGGLFQYQ
ncbi:hypothetical protein HPP92_008046 [Vanilla planifolia]|nr:hypothetical protein HPP92_008046 [Vanilla planifolia]